MLARECVLAVDIGTSATKAVIFDRQGRILTIARRPYPLLTPRPDWAEQEPDVVLTAVLKAMETAYQNRPAETEVAAISFSAQWYSIMPIGADGRPLANYLTWSDRRSAQIAHRLRESPNAREIFEATGCPIDAIYPLSKIVWLKQGEAGAKASRFISIKEYVLRHLFGEYVVDWGMAAATGLLDIRRAGWHGGALATAGITGGELSTLVPPRTILTRWKSDVCTVTGIPQGTPCVLGGGDGALASIGVGAIDPGVGAVNVGTSAAARYLSRKPMIDPRGRLWTYLVDEDWWVVGGIVSSGAVVSDWFARTLAPSGQTGCTTEATPPDLHAAINEMAASVAPGAEGVVFLPYLSGEQCPVWDPRTTGAFLGLTLRHGRAHLARAVYEGITMSIARVVEAIGEIFEPIRELRVTGGLVGSSTWLRIAADMLGARIHVPETVEGSALGAAMMAWLALGMIPDFNAARAVMRSTAMIEPDPTIHQLYLEHLKAADRILQAVKTARN